MHFFPDASSCSGSVNDNSTFLIGVNKISLGIQIYMIWFMLKKNIYIYILKCNQLIRLVCFAKGTKDFVEKPVDSREWEAKQCIHVFIHYYQAFVFVLLRPFMQEVQELEKFRTLCFFQALLGQVNKSLYRQFVWFFFHKIRTEKGYENIKKTHAK